MSITVADCLNLAALREAQIVAGLKGLSKIVSSVSVLEYAEPSVLVDDLFVGNELVISAFVSIKDDVQAQLSAVRRLHETGEVGLVLYYVGIFLPKIDERLVALADNLGFPLIVMAPDRFDFRYSEIITEVMDAVIKDQMRETYFVSGMLDRISQLQQRQRTIGTVLRMLSDRLRCSLLLVERTLEQRGAAAWPMAMRWNYDELLADYKAQRGLPPREQPEFRQLNDRRVSVVHTIVQLEQRPDMLLITLNEDEPVLIHHLKQAAEVVQLFFSIWKYDFGHEGADGLVKAILNDEPNHMRRIADALHIDVSSIHTMWVLRERVRGPMQNEERERRNARRAVVAKLFLQERHKLALVDTYEDAVAMFLGNPSHQDLDWGLPEELLSVLGEEEPETLLVICPGLKTTRDVRAAYLLIKSAQQAAETIYPKRRCLSTHELRFAQSCIAVLNKDEAATDEALAPLTPLYALEDRDMLLETLAAFLLDAESSMQETGNLLYLHKNTIKYRINKIKQCLGYDLTRLPEAYPLYFAAALSRLMK